VSPVEAALTIWFATLMENAQPHYRIVPTAGV